MFIFNTFCCI
jgi:hypothetical protein